MRVSKVYPSDCCAALLCYTAVQVEAMKHGFAIRTALGDPGTPDKPYPHADSINAAVADLLSDDFINKLRGITKDNDVLPDTAYGGRWVYIQRPELLAVQVCVCVLSGWSGDRHVAVACSVPTVFIHRT